jgi:hypothetical protein
MCAARAVRSVATMIKRTPNHPIRILAIAVAASLAFALTAWPSIGEAAGKTQTLRFFSKPVAFTYTSVDGTVTQGPPAGESRPGDVFEIDSVGYRGNHRRHATRSTMSDYLRCTIVADGPPDCFSFAAIRGSMLRFHGSKVIGGTGRYQGATGKVIKNEEAGGGSDIVARIRVR